MVLMYATRGCAVYTLADLGLIHGPPETALAHLVKMTSRLCETEGAYLGVVDDATATVHCPAHCCMGEDLRPVFEFAQKDSFVRVVRDRNTAMEVSDAVEEPLIRAGFVEKRFGLRGLVGAPVRGPDDDPIGALVAFSRGPRSWSSEARENILSMAYLASQIVLLRASMETIKLMRIQGGLKSA